MKSHAQLSYSLYDTVLGMMAGSGFTHPAVEDVNDADLLVKWKEITHALLDRGHAAVLYHILTLRTGHENPLGSPVAGPVYPQNRDARSITDRTGTNVSSNEFSGDAASPFCQDESDTDDIYSIYDDYYNIPRDLVSDARDLSKYLHPKSLATSEEQRYLTGNDKAECSFDDAPDHLDIGTSHALATSWSPTLPSVSDQDQQLSARPDPEPAQGLVLDFQDVIIDDLNKVKATSLILKPPPKKRKRSTKPGMLRISDKRNLTPPQIPIVANLLVSRDAISDFLQNRLSICENLKPFSVSPSEICSNNLERSVITAFETIQELLSGNRVCRLLSRFASIRLTSLIDAYKAVAATDRIQAESSRRRGRGDATVAIDMYLQAKRETSSEISERSRILGYCRTGRRWKTLAGRAPILVFLFPQIAETIVQNNSIRDGTLKALATRVERNHPKLIEVLEVAGEDAGVAFLSTAGTVSRLENDPASIFQGLGAVLKAIPQDLLYVIGPVNVSEEDGVATEC